MADSGDTVLVAPGEYSWGVECAAIRNGVVVRSDLGAASTIIFAWQWGPMIGGGLIKIEAGAGPTTELDGFTIQCYDYAQVPLYRALVMCYPGSQPRIRNNVIYPHPWFPETLVDADVIAADGAFPVVTGNTIDMRAVRFGNARAIAAYGGAGVTSRNNIIFRANYGFCCSAPSSSTSDCNILWQVDCPFQGCEPGPNDASVDPLLCLPEQGNYFVRSDSPALDGDCGLIGALPMGCEPTVTSSLSWGALKARLLTREPR